MRSRENATGKPKGRLLWMSDHEDRAVLLREHLQLAGVTRAELFASDRTRRAITFHDLRATGITWAAARGDDSHRIKQRAGHKSFSTTEIYIREAENLREGFGTPFPPLPADLARVSARVSAFRRPATRGRANFPWYQVEQRGIEPATTIHPPRSIVSACTRTLPLASLSRTTVRPMAGPNSRVSGTTTSSRPSLMTA